MNAAWAYDAIAEFYDDDMALNAEGQDIDYYRRLCLAARGASFGRILELGCGTGRITLPLCDAGFEIVGIDRSVPMLNVLRRKCQTQLCARPPMLAAMDMGRPGFVGSFDVILCPFSAFTYLVEETDLRRALEAIRTALAEAGRFILDVFVPNPRIASCAAGEMFDYRRRLPNGLWLERRKTITLNTSAGVNRIVRRYNFLDAGERCLREVSTESHQRSYWPHELIGVLRDAGFQIVSVTADFIGMTVGPLSRTIIVEARSG